MKRAALALAVLAAAVCCAATAVQADIILFTLDNVTFDDGGMATGSFDYDSTTNVLSNVEVTTTTGSVVTGTTYTGTDIDIGGPFGKVKNGSTGMWRFSFADSDTETRGIVFEVSSPLSLTGANTLIGGFEITGLVDGGCLTGTVCPSRSFATGSLDPSVNATPLPAALPLFATGLGALALLGWRRRRATRSIAA